MDFSVVLASRQRVPLLIQLIKSLADHSYDISKIEILIGIDDDDVDTLNAMPILTRQYPYSKFFVRKRSNMLNRDYINWVYDCGGSGRFIIACNDDAAFRTVGWDKIALDKLNSYLIDKPDEIVYAFINDELTNRNGLNYCCFPLVSRAAYKILGWIMPPQFPAWNADVWLWKTYLGVGRILDLSEIMIEHIAFHSGKRERDEVSYNVQKLSSYDGEIDFPIKNYINLLAKEIERCKSKIFV